MTNNFRVFNVSRGYSLKRKQALKAIDNCAAIWVEENVSIRDLTIAESLAARNEQARMREPLEYAEIHGLRYDPPSSGVEATRRERPLIFAAHEFLRSVAA